MDSGATCLDLLADMLRTLHYVNVYSESVVLKAAASGKSDVLYQEFKRHKHVDGQAAALVAQIAYLPIKDYNQAISKVGACWYLKYCRISFNLQAYAGIWLVRMLLKLAIL